MLRGLQYPRRDILKRKTHPTFFGASGSVVSGKPYVTIHGHLELLSSPYRTLEASQEVTQNNNQKRTKEEMLTTEKKTGLVKKKKPF